MVVVVVPIVNPVGPSQWQEGDMERGGRKAVGKKLEIDDSGS